MKKLLIILSCVTLLMLCLVGCGKKEVKKPVGWPRGNISKVIPVLDVDEVDLVQEKEENAVIIYHTTDSSIMRSYAEKCRDAGFNINVQNTEKIFSARNTDNYSMMIINHADSEKNPRIEIFIKLEDESAQ